MTRWRWWVVVLYLYCMVTLYVVTSYEHFCGALAVFANSPQNAAKCHKMPQILRIGNKSLRDQILGGG
jgi:hypothetical protein